MATSNQERQKQYREAKTQSGQARVSCWLDEDDNDRLLRLMKYLDESEGKKKSGYSTVISQALKELEISLTPAPQREVVRYGLRIMKSRDN
ncbi:MAG: hypothetical protein GQ529_13595 [Methyloprofundus sp.]|nr:hypothetical protein [Methyloprofundus sp.]